MKAAWQSVEDVCGILIYIPFFSSAVGSYLSHSFTPRTNLTGAAINKLKLVPSGGRRSHGVDPTWDLVSPNISLCHLCLSGWWVGGFAWTRCVYTQSVHKSFRSVISGREGRHKGVWTAFFEMDNFPVWSSTSPGGSKKGSEVKRGRASNGPTNQRSHTWLRDEKWLSFSETRVLCANFPESSSFATALLLVYVWSDLTCDVTFHPADEVEKKAWPFPLPNFLQETWPSDRLCSA